MRARSRSFALLTFCLLAFLLVRAPGASLAVPQDPDASRGPDASQGTVEIAEQMEIVSGGLKRLRRTLKDSAQRTESLAILAEVERAALAAKQGTPPMTDTLPEGEREAFVTAYRKTIAELLTRMLELEVALLDADLEKAQELYERVKAMENLGHARFTEDG